MAKSAGGFLTLAAVKEKGFDPRDYRYLCLGAHYRSQLQFSWEALEAAASGRRGLAERLVRLREEELSAAAPGGQVPRAPRGAGPAVEQPAGLEAGPEQTHLQAFRAELADDLNSPRGLAVLWGLLRDSSLPPDSKMRGALAMDRILGLGLETAGGAPGELEAEEQALLEERTRARRARDWARADALRRELAQRGVQVEDTPGGVRWKKL